ncbi:DUF962 domain-containing protein [Psychrosphaera sp. B3R10]|uniref:DUF962 domain-containing protein n=1 Tax=Psychrosphaera algicola TaxID=3023714 RepID=A0ABT5F998_9GAMM|nr:MULTISPECIES: Mpo1-like protein [unclassified Psychrosphaera]MBU2881272.1 DUF962 domain-containing protein [Psychrosphaera sp. I2R16]MBU2988371.1 DUF962 domain-containing protein [Psychrosphaera sp. B3R10]MDC2888106.1 DUF962 domain-containing protein [Psychrosphaera sp. G1-22]MDO6720129.1 DUF962 domain-containing protein [Psychrosphaera sp. 1_MG-2023]
MKTIRDWLKEYRVSHQNKTNKLIHYLCVPAIFLSVIGMLWTVPLPFDTGSDWINVATLISVFVAAFYFRLSISVGIGMSLFIIFCFAFVRWWTQSFEMGILTLSVGIFVIAWILQFVGHEIEGKKPSFFKDLQFLLIGPAWILCHIFRKFHIKY